jgi:hypothetical protein
MPTGTEERNMVKKKTVKRSKPKSSTRVKDLTVKKTTAVKGGMYRRSDPCTGEELK